MVGSIMVGAAWAGCSDEHKRRAKPQNAVRSLREKRQQNREKSAISATGMSVRDAGAPSSNLGTPTNENNNLAPNDAVGRLIK
jgi:hypothetical protein